jgi:hypothetical protein
LCLRIVEAAHDDQKVGEWGVVQLHPDWPAIIYIALNEVRGSLGRHVSINEPL